MVEEEMSGAGGSNNLEQARDAVGGPPGEQSGSESSEGGIEMRQTVVEPPSRDSARVVRTLLLGRPYEEWHHRVSGPNGGGQGWVILDPEISSEPDDGDVEADAAVSHLAKCVGLDEIVELIELPIDVGPNFCRLSATTTYFFLFCFYFNLRRNVSIDHSRAFLPEWTDVRVS